MSVSYGGSNITFDDGSTVTSGWSGMKNRIINGAMVIDQRNSGASITPAANAYSLDRWLANMTAASKYSVQQVSDAPSGFSKSLKVTSTSAYAGASGDYQTIQHRIEGYNTADLAWGTASASTVTLSFWVKSSISGVYALGLYSASSAPTSYITTYTINASNTWEYKTITIPGDTLTSTYDSTVSIGTIINFTINGGSSFSTGTINAWQLGNFCVTPGVTNLLATNGATFQITGVQLERGTTASSFEYRPFGTELQLCMRYFQKFDYLGTGISNAGGTVAMICPYLQPMRAAPTASVAGTTWAISDNYIADVDTSSPTIPAVYAISNTSCRYSLGGFTGLTTGRWYGSRPVSTSLIAFSAEI
jgi:hypothetical protein